MKKTLFKNNNSAVAGVIEALLIVALVAIIISTIQLTYIPEIMSQREADHMRETSNQFSYIKSIIDLQSTTKQNTPVTTTLDLSCGAIPYFVTMASTGELRIIEDSKYEINIDFDATQIPLTKINLTSYNNYYLDGDDINFALEGGAVFLKQEEGSAMRVPPSISVENETNDINIYYDIPIIVGVEGKTQVAGNEIVHIRSNYSSADSSYLSDTDVTNLKIYSDYAEYWYEYLNEILSDNVNYVLNDDNVEITKKIKNINFYYKRTYIYIQIGEGYIR